METKRLYTVDGEAIDIFPLNTPIRHKEHPNLTGRIIRYEFHESGAISPLPYRVEWDDDALAREVLGVFRIYASNENIEPRPAPTAYFLTVEWCRDGHRGIFCDKNGRGFREDDTPHTEEEMHAILGPFLIILDPKSEPFTEEELAEHTWFRPLAEYHNQYGIALRDWEGEK